MPEIINKSIVGLGFGYLHDDEIKKLSVKQITNSSTFDTVRQPIVGGLYDRAMGPTDISELCETCGLKELDCPGHPGHIQLSVPVYNVFLFELLLKLLNMKCWNCHHLRLSSLKKKSIFCQLLYLQSGQILRAREVAELGTGVTVGKNQETINGTLDSTLDRHISYAKKIIDSQSIDGPTTYTSHVSEVRHKLVKQFLALGRTPKCGHCGAASPTVRRDGFTKIFVQPLNQRQRNENDKLGIRLWSIMSNTWDNAAPVAPTPPVSKPNASKKSVKSASKRRSSNDSDDDSASDDDGEDDDMFLEDDEHQALFGESQQQVEKAVSAAEATRTSSTNVEETQARLILPNEVERHLHLLWQSSDAQLLSLFFAPGTRTKVANCPYNGNDYHAFFHRVLLVPPSRFRPPSFLNGEYFESNANLSYRKIFDASEEIIRCVFTNDSSNNVNKSNGKFLGSDATTNLEHLTPVIRKRVIDSWINMQHEVNLLFDSDKTGSQLQSGGANTGVKQLLEKKQGLFRKHMMGKRVNFAARSVISPDPYLHSREIGVPDIFAKTLTYPECVNSYNITTMRQAIINGPNVHPGANKIINGRGKEIKLGTMTRDERIALANRLMSKESSVDPSLQSHRSVTSVEKTLQSSWVGDCGPYVVLRHLRSGDVLIVNRQPTLHKPSMMTHVARVLYGENVLRMHYSNCSSYNADFDGDEMNLHFPQNELARIEAYDIANNDNQYIVPTNGGPLRGLIQDHVICGVRLTSRDCFLNREYFQQFLFLAIADQDIQKGNAIHTPQPSILKPRPMWTGKQLINSVLDYICAGRPPINMAAAKTKVPGAIWGKQGQEDGFVVIRQNRLVHGVLDKSQFGASSNGLVHSIYELYGARAASDTLTILARLFTRVLQYDAFTCGLEDFLLTTEADIVRRGLISHSSVHGIQATADCAGMEGDVRTFGPNKVNEAVQRFYSQHSNAGEMLDNAVKAALSQDTSNIIKACIPGGQRIPFPRNQMAMMTLTGAKGSAVNHSQIACLLGQQELEGRRVPVTMTGKTLPSFPRYDPQPRAGGYIAQRFFTGIKPQEYYFHHMAGREGLVDTAVKTANSGYLQRCIIKLLESLAIRYDNTVRDCDGGLVQFAYGEDGIDVVKSAYLNNMYFLANNFHPLMVKLRPSHALNHLDCTSIEDKGNDIDEQRDALEQLTARHEELVAKEDAKLQVKATDGKKQLKDKDIRKVEAKRAERLEMIAQAQRDLDLAIASSKNAQPKMFDYPFARTLGAVSEKYEHNVDHFITTDPEGIFAQSELMKERWESRIEDYTAQLHIAQQSFTSNTLSAQANPQIQHELQHRADVLQQQINDLKHELENRITPEKFRVLMNLNYIASLAAPGENVGVLAGQSVGEPSTQMTLNTFHLAGHGGANVTLGIPRLREIVMTASDHISTPIMEIPLLDPSPQAAAKLAAKLNKIRLRECLTGIRVSQATKVADGGCHEYNIRLDLQDLNSEWATNNLVSIYHILTCVCTEFARKLNVAVKQKLKTSQSAITSRTIKSHADIITNAEDVEEEAAVENDDVNTALDAAQRRQLKNLEEGATESAAERKKKQQSSYDDDEEEEQEKDEEDDTDDISKDDKKSKVKKEDNAQGSDDEDASDDEGSDDDESDSNDSMDDKVKPTKKVTKKSANLSPPTLEQLEDSANSNQDLHAFMRRLQPSWGKHDFITRIDVDYENSSYIDITVTTHQGAPKLLMLSTVERLCEISRVRYTAGINRAMVIERKSEKGKVKIVQTDGVNFPAVWSYPEVDQAHIKTNDIHQILNHYGCEAAAASIRNEISGVFAVYGIGVDPRHLSLISDFMTFRGGYHAMNRMAMNDRPSVMQKASFETSLKFVIDACNTGEFDHLSSPSSAIVVGKPIQSGTNLFDLKQPLILSQKTD